MLAIIKTGGKQYKVEKGTVLKIEKIDKKPGSKIIFKDVLLYADSKDFKVGQPILKEVKVEGEILEQGRDKKVKVVKYKPKVRYYKTAGHRQEYTEIKITAISLA
ncbi:MAG: 50S ribosomal protein L21 [Patescibacteria group bacterium]|jgi:large subunit ribosomal protein L21|nr:50S ribosomal protein L21 [Patescibacteria group bacterium]